MMKVPTPMTINIPGTRCRSLRRRLPRSWPTRSSAPSSSGCGSPTPRWPARRRWCSRDLLLDGPGRCPGCGLAGVYRDAVERRVSDVPVVGHPLELRVRVPRYRCVHDGCAREVFAHDTSRLARPGASTTRRCAAFILRRLMLDKATVAAVARELGRSWDTVNGIAVEATRELLLTAGPARLEGVEVIGVDEHKWAHVRGAQADGFVTVITDLTAVVAGHGPARLLDMVPGRSAAAHDRLARGPLPGLPRPGPDRGHGRVRRLQERRHHGAAGRGHGDGPVPRRRPRRARSSTCAASASSRTPSGTAAAPATRSTGSGAPCAPASGCSPTASAPGWRRCSPTRSTSRSR